MTKEDISTRKEDILSAVVEDYINTAEPVGSFTITKHYLRSVSPATVRNEMQELEQFGYITHPHTSAGRIPTDNGYRYYVDKLMETKKISGKELTLIRSGIKKIGRGMEEIMRGSLKMISSLLNYATVFVSFGKNKRTLSSGFSKILTHPEFQKAENIKNVIETLEHEQLICKILEEYSKFNPFSLHIGHENKFKHMKDLSIVVAHHHLRGFDPGAIGIIGPTRMDYNRVTAILKQVSNDLEALINEEIPGT
ncbi:hypothetical protein A2230_07440 [candidate division WOR-1 bacterium RIFOXYA2_FULL_36_21]|uniref:Heat-inducible transcription repressor HrcA n=1 Tax=candidate division WOR-1 bacterium RIFOXYB2_FULL_36_35 TaxID=1802578 RepID=A0A1F4S8T5_UNCSA|nr:MAG: hypothetical protein A2230_07440 [candidate division WOR-1 bacterium RIFOXYA2_FULL_36_21]OGC16819.1 MAG: hypothetical protein A2290_08040 [candidate division WOR-1 bacterium RIFOXYB2_FULL_36_35]OGC16960.1 MAG: hypothetical protein A2282_08670 [candidate division WOR-1 bacterium RIFOXYA12_FULL_36_13]